MHKMATFAKNLLQKSVTLFDEIQLTGTTRLFAAPASKVLPWMAVLLLGGLFFCSESQAQQDGTIVGTVTDSTNGQPLPGVNVVIANTQQGTSTDQQGNFRIADVEPGSYTLQASFVGYATMTRDVEVEAGETTTVNFVLAPSEVALEEMVVTALGIERQERSLSYSTQEVEGADLKQARELNVGTSLKGKVSGLRVNQAATGVGGDVRMVIRGNRSISGSSQPLFVVDGVPIRGDISDINPDNIQSIEVLKGPNAAALYGNEAQNGVVLITTESGDEGQIEFSFTQNTMARVPHVLTKYQNVYGQGSAGQYSPGSEFSWGPKMNGQTVAHWSPDPELQGEEYSFTPQPDNVRDVYQVGWNSSTNVTATMGSESVQSIFSYTFTRAKGTVPNNNLERHNVMAKVNGQPTENLSLTGKLSYNRENIENSLQTGENFANPNRHALRLPRNIRTAHASDFEYFNTDGLRRQNYWNPGSNGGANPYWTLNRNLNENVKDRILALASGTYDFTSYLNLRVRASIDVANNQGRTKWFNDTYIIAQNGQFNRSRSNDLRWDGNALLTYDDDITENWSITASAGGNWRQERNSFLGANTGSRLTIPNFFSLSNTQNVQVSSSEGAPRDVQSVFGRGEISWKDAIFLEGTARNDWSSTLPPGNWSFFYPSVGASAVLTDLFPGIFPDFINFAKVRGSWAEVGNEAPPFQTVRTANFSAGGRSGFLQLSSTLPAENLKPEETKSWEVGTQIRAFGGRLETNVTLYHTETKNQLFTLALPVASGASQAFTNGGNVRNQGIEVELSSVPVQLGDFQWDARVNFAANRNLVKKIHQERPRVAIGGSFLGTNFVEEGEPFGQYFSRGFARDDQGRVIVGDDGVPELTPGETVQIADFNPDWTGSINNTFSYGNATLSFLIDHRQGGTVGSFTNAILAADGSLKRTLKGRGGGLVFGENVFPEETAVHDGSTGNIPSTTAENFWRTLGGRNTPVGEAFSESATATKLRELRIGYTLPQSLLGTSQISAVNVSFVARDLFWIYRESERINPDMLQGTGPGSEGFESFTPPDTRSFGLNINLVF